jgi:hypothetical protein
MQRLRLAVVVNTYNPGYSGDGDRRILGKS